MAIGLLLVGLLTATAASAQSADLDITSIVDSADPVATGGRPLLGAPLNDVSVMEAK